MRFVFESKVVGGASFGIDDHVDGNDDVREVV